MDNDNKISTRQTDTKDDVMLFLEEELVSLKKKDKVIAYDLETEYAKTKKNRIWSIWVVLILTVAGVFCITYFTSRALQKKNRTVDVNLSVFEDINLKNLFDAMSKTQDLYEKAAKNKAELQAGLDTKLDQARRLRDSELAIVEKAKLRKKQLKERQDEITKTYNNAVYRAHTEFDEKIKAAEIELKQYEEQLKGFDSENVAKAQSYEQKMDSERQLHELEKDRIAKEYEDQINALKQSMSDSQEKSFEERKTAMNDVASRYEKRLAALDPVIKDSREKSIVAGLEEVTYADAISTESIAGTMVYPDDQYINSVSVLKARYDDFVYLNSIASKLPYLNSMPEVLRGERRKAYEMSRGIALAGASRVSELKGENSKLTAQVEKLTSDLAGIKSAYAGQSAVLETCANLQKVDGFVMAKRSDGTIIVFVKSTSREGITQSGNTTVSVYANDTKVGEGTLWFKDSIYFMSLTDEAVQVSSGYMIKINN
ncbi:MAG: hypothetical protein MJ169_01655 [Treponema sp.]|nr:hypothetical protein [Treponema sp.]